MTKNLETIEQDQPTEGELKKLQAEVKRLRSEAATRDAQLKAFEDHREGWLIETPNILYDDVRGVHHLKFVDGAVFMPVDSEIESFKLEAIPDDEVLWEQVISRWSDAKYQDFADLDFKKQKLAEMKEALLKSHKMSSVERCVKIIEKDFGYKVTFYKSDQWDELQAHLKERHQARLELEAQGSKDNLLARKLMGVNRRGVITGG